MEIESDSVIMDDILTCIESDSAIMDDILTC